MRARPAAASPSLQILIDDRWRVKIADFGLSRMRHRTFLSSSAQVRLPCPALQ